MLIIICAIPFAGYVGLQFPSVQTKIARSALSSVNDSINGSISIDRVTIVFFNKLIAYDMSIVGSENDTIAFIGKLSVEMSAHDLLRGKLKANRIVVEDAMFCYRNYNIITKDNNISRAFNIRHDSTKVKKPLSLPDMQASNIVLKNIRFKYISTSPPRRPGRKIRKITDPRCFDSRNIDVQNINARIHRARYSDGVLTCRIRDLSGKDRCGYEIKSLSGFFAMDSSETSIQNLLAIDSYSKVIANYLSFGYTSGKDVNDYVNKIVMGGDFRHTTLDFRSIGTFAQSLRDNDLVLDVTGEIIGPVRDLRSEGLKLKYKDSTDLFLDIRITGLPKIKNTVFTATFHDVTTNGPELEEIIRKFSKSKKDNSLGETLPQQRFTLTGEYSGTIYDGESDGIITLDNSSIAYDATIFDHFNEKGFDVDAALDIDNLDAGALAKTPILGKISLNTSAQLNFKKKRDGGGMSFEIDTLHIQKIGINGYNYRDIDILGELKDNLLNIKLTSNDKAFSTELHADVRFKDGFKPENITAYLNIPHADLKETNIVKNRDLSVASVLAHADITTGSDGTPLGCIIMDSIIYANNYGRFVLDSLDIYSYMNDNAHNIDIHSPILSANYTGTDNISGLIENIRSNILHYSLPMAFEAESHEAQNDTIKLNSSYRFNITTHNTSPVTKVIVPGLHIADNSRIDFTLDGNSQLNFDLRSKFVVLNNNRFKDISATMDNRDSILKAQIYVDDISLGNTPLQKSRISATALSDGIHLNIGFENTDDSKLDLASVVNLYRNDNGKICTQIDFKPSLLDIKGHKWTLDPSGITLLPEHYIADNIFIYSTNQSILIDGHVSRNEQDKIKIDFSNFDISLFNSFGKQPLGFYGHISGDAELSKIFTSMGITLSLEGNELILFDRKFGNVKIASRWDQNRKRFNLMLNNKLYGQTPLNAYGYFIPDQSYMNLTIDMDHLQTYYITPFIENAAEISDGTISGSLKITGKMKDLSFNANDIELNSIKVTPKFTNVTYSISGPVDLKERNIDFKQIEIFDPNGAKATLEGTIFHNHLKDFNLDLGLTFKDLMAINTTEYQNDMVYGTAYATGKINITGPFDGLKIDLNVATGDNSAIHVPMRSSSSASTTNLISYTNFSDTSKAIDIDRYIDSLVANRPKPKRDNNLQITGHAEVSQSTELMIELNKQLGEVLKCRGNGSIDLNIAPSKNVLDLRGDYNITSGNYHFVAMSIVSRDFTLDNGGSITFNGDIKNTDLDVHATYQTKASISTLIADTTSVGNRKTVNCSINLAGSLSNPELSFGINIPDLDPITKGMVESALSTPDKIQRQFMSLLISGSFVPDEQSSIVNNSSLLYSNASEILSNQFNNIFRQLEIPLDLGLNYERDANSGKDMFDVAISYQAFNNRLIINGNVGNSKTSSAWAGDLDVEIKVDKQGKLRVMIFTRAADSYTNYLDNTQRSGFGISYQDEFDTFGEFIRSIFYTKKRKEQYELEKISKTERELLEEAKANQKNGD